MKVACLNRLGWLPGSQPLVGLPILENPVLLGVNRTCQFLVPVIQGSHRMDQRPASSVKTGRITTPSRFLGHGTRCSVPGRGTTCSFSLTCFIWQTNRCSWGGNAGMNCWCLHGTICTSGDVGERRGD